MELRAVFACVVLALAAACDAERTTVASSEPSDADKQSAWIAEMQLRVKNDLRDPSSAEFRNVRFSRAGGVPTVCGEVNSTNAFGGKAGFQRFLAAGDLRVLEEQMEDGGMDDLWQRFCP